MTISRFPAGRDDDGQFAGFTCWDGDPAKPWALEAQNYIRGYVLRHSGIRVFKWCEGDSLVAVVSFGTRTLGLPLVEPTDYKVWHLEVTGVSVTRQGEGLGALVLRETLDVLSAEDPDRVLVTANVHKANLHAIRTLATAGITPLVPMDDAYWTFLGEL